MKVCNLNKQYPTGKIAVQSISFGLHAGTCFGFLGINGAGKTTTMKMMTGDEGPTKGEGYIGGRNIVTDQMGARLLIGYCPQFDGLLDLLTVREHLELYASIRGVDGKDMKITIRKTMDGLGITQFAGKLAGTLSGGNKRKLSVGIALIGGKNHLKLFFLLLFNHQKLLTFNHLQLL